VVEGGLQIGGRLITNLRRADYIGIILLATSEAELQQLVDRLDRVSRKYSILINVDKTKPQGNGKRRHCVPHTHSEQLEVHIPLVKNVTLPIHCPFTPLYEKFHKIDKNIVV